MSQQLLTDTGGVVLSEQEASLMVALHAEAQQKDGATTLRDIAETLHISLSEAENLLNQVRQREAPVTPAAVPVTQAAPRRRRLHIVPLVAAIALAYLGFRYFITNNQGQDMVSTTSSVGQIMVTPAATSPAMPNTAPFATIPGPSAILSSSSEFGLGLVLGNWKREATGSFSPHSKPLRDLSGQQTGVLKTKLTESIFDLLQSSKGDPAAAHAGFATIWVQPAFGSWSSFDLPVEGSLQTSMDQFDSRQRMREELRELVDANWEKFVAAQSKE